MRSYYLENLNTDKDYHLEFRSMQSIIIWWTFLINIFSTPIIRWCDDDVNIFEVSNKILCLRFPATSNMEYGWNVMLQESPEHIN